MAEKLSNKDQLKQITAGIEQGIMELFQSDRYRNYLATMSWFHSYSLNNVMLIHSQNPDATLVAGRKRWQTQFGRRVLEDQRYHGINIIAPASFKKKVSQEKLDPDTQLPVLDRNGNPVMETKMVNIPYFKVVQVFDVSQTDGKALPQLSMDLTGDVAQYEVFLEALRRSSPVPIDIKPITGDMDGYLSLSNQRITLREGMSQVQTICAGVHEVAHAKLHNFQDNAIPENAEVYQTIEIFDIPGLFSNGRIKSADIPSGLFRYDLRGSDDDPGDPVAVEEFVMVNHAASILTAKPLDIPEGGSLWLTEEEGLNFTGDEMTAYQFRAEQQKDRGTEEVEAESISYAVCQYFGIETADNSFGYIATWSQGKELKELRSSLETINKTASELIGSIDHHFREICKERGIELSAQQEEPDSLTKLASDLEQYQFDVDTFGYLDSVGSREDGLREITETLVSGDVQDIRDYLQEVLAEGDEHCGAAQALLDRLDVLIPVQPPKAGETELDAVSAFANEFAAYVTEGSKGMRLPGIPMAEQAELAVWAEEHLRNSNFRPLSDALLDVITISGQDARFDDLSERLAHMNLYGVEQKEAVPTPSKRPVYKLVSNFNRMSPEETTYVQKYLPCTDSRLIPAEIVYIGTYEECLEIQSKLRDGSMTAQQAKALDDSEKMYVVSDATYLHIQRTDIGFDYSLYDKASSKLIDGGQLDSPEQHIYSACLEICKLHDLDSFAVNYAPIELAASLRDAQIQPTQRDRLDQLADHFSQQDASAWASDSEPSAPERQIGTPQPDPYYTQQHLYDFGYTAPDMYPISTDFALELMERDVPVYMLNSDNTEAMAFDSEDLATHVGMIGITHEDWYTIKEQPDILALRDRFVVSYQRDLAAGVIPQSARSESHLKAVEMSMEDDYGMIDGIINNGKSPGTDDSRKEKKPSVLDKLKSEPAARKPKTTPKKSSEREI